MIFNNGRPVPDQLIVQALDTARIERFKESTQDNYERLKQIFIYYSLYIQFTGNVYNCSPDPKATVGGTSTDSCFICISNVIDTVCFPCFHAGCRRCLVQWLRNSSSLPSLSSISTLLADPVMAVVRRIEENTTQLLNQVSVNTTNILINSRDLDDLHEITERIQNRQRAQHLRVVEFISGVENHITESLDHELERIRNIQNNLANSLVDQSERILNAMAVFDRANNYFIEQLNRLVGHPNI
uniref:Zinc finger C3HC4 RING-type domain-containing protein n=1 Tax=Tetranychus urticae TaxID=32264 RepID=T1K9W4_TETUR